MSRRCPACGAGVPPPNAFCGACGTRVGVEPPAEQDALIGRVVDDRYRILEKVGQGGMGAVYLAEHVGIGKRVAVKVLRADLRGNADLVRRFRREAMAVSRLTDAHTITVFDFGVWQGLVYLAMEYLRGVDLAALLAAEGRLPPARAIAIARQICSSLAEAHAVGLVHRDLKPENVFLTRTTGGEEIVKVLDFGLAKMVAGRTDGGEAGFQTQDGVLLGTPYFMAPEQVRGGPIDARTDLYALGALLFRMVTGTHPYRGRTPIEVMEGHLSSPLPTFAEVGAGDVAPAGLEALVRRLMARVPAQRPATALVVAEELARLAASLEAAPAPASSIPAETPAEGASLSVAGETATPPPFAGRFDSGSDAPPPGGAVSGAFEGDSFAEGFADATRSDIARYERRLRRRARARALAAGALLAAVLAGAVWALRPDRHEPPPEEVEPNDQAAEATPIAEGRPIRGFLGRRRQPEHSDRDLFLVDVPPDRPYATATVTGVPGIDLVLEGYDTEGYEVFEANGRPAGEGEEVRDHRVDAERLILVVREVWISGVLPSENVTDPYTLEVRFSAAPRSPPPPGEAE